MPIIKPSRNCGPIYTTDTPPTGVYYGVLKEVLRVNTKKDKPGLRFQWEATKDHLYYYNTFITYGLKSGLLSLMTYNWLGKRICDFPKFANGCPDLIHLIGKECGLYINQVSPTFSTIVDFFPVDKIRCMINTTS